MEFEESEEIIHLLSKRWFVISYGILFRHRDSKHSFWNRDNLSSYIELIAREACYILTI